MNITIISLLFLLQTGPALQRRSAPAASSSAHAPAQIEQGYSTLPADASGEYVLDEHGSVVQITIDRNRLTGYVTQMEHETALTLFFTRTSIHGSQISFATTTVHGTWYSFRGSIVRGDAVRPADPGFYRLTGEWTSHRGSGTEAMRVSLKSTPRVDEDSE